MCIYKHWIFIVSDIQPVQNTPNQVFEFLYLGNLDDAKNLERLKELGIGYVLNMAYGESNFYPEHFKVTNYKQITTSVP